ncbi:helix-turn-helix transcriptional regulator [Frankia sp. AgW1.1]|uniref:helix-turn-helix domain-containing protein n=1 Tax=Frankia sp. AgW1.1 TaxID=1836971 RepID=UPI0019338E86|nr:helix-turn-helix transcriptional regulator [Frankia sp. AgW1.1]MBL7494374.1 helix-turn-helix transcriptional regulator [Frankia sp. AgW1.1]
MSAPIGRRASTPISEAADEAATLFLRRVRAIRQERRISAQELAELVGMSRDVLANAENGRRPFICTLPEAIALARALDVDLVRMLDPAPMEIAPAQPAVVRVVQPERPAVVL